MAEDVTVNKGSLATSMHNINDSVGRLTQTLQQKGVLSSNQELRNPQEQKSSLDRLKERIDAICSKPPITLEELDEMFMTPSEKERLQQLHIQEVEQSVQDSLTQKTVDQITTPAPQPLPTLPRIDVPGQESAQQPVDAPQEITLDAPPVPVPQPEPKEEKELNGLLSELKNHLGL